MFVFGEIDLTLFSLGATTHGAATHATFTLGNFAFTGLPLPPETKRNYLDPQKLYNTNFSARISTFDGKDS